MFFSITKLQSQQTDQQTPQNGVALTAAERFALLTDIARIGLLLGQDRQESPLPLALQGEPEPDASPLERLALLSALWQQALPALCAAQSHPDTALQQTDRSVPLPQLHGTPQTANRLARNPRQIASWLAAQNGADVCRLNLPEARPQSTTNTTANRFLVTFLQAWHDEAATLARLAEFCGETAEAERIGTVAQEVAFWCSRPEWRNLAPLPPHRMTDVGTESVRWPVAHRILAELWLKSQQGFRLDWENSLAFALPALQEWELYEIWCYLRVAAVLREAGWRPQTGDALRVTQQGIRLALAKGKASRLHFTRHKDTLTLCYQPLFPSANQSQTEDTSPRFVSRSHAMQPDIALEWHSRLLLLDPKFRAYEQTAQTTALRNFRSDNALLDDINKMHTYRDAIVLRGERVVSAAWCLTPGGPQAAQTIFAYPHSTPAHPFGTAGIGAILLRPGASDTILSLLLADWFADEQT